MQRIGVYLALTLTILSAGDLIAQSYRIIDTGQARHYGYTSSIEAPEPGQPFYGQDAQHQGTQPSYRDNGDGTVADLNTGLMWQQKLPNAKYTYAECVVYADTCTVGGYTDWRLPTIKELYSLVLFSGQTGRDESTSVPYLDTDYFDFRFGGTVVAGERFIDSQYATSAIYRGTTMGGNETMFGFNFVDGRIKGYPTFKQFDLKLVRGRQDYGVNNLMDNSDGTVTDWATGLMWDQSGSAEGMDWKAALGRAQERNAEDYLGYSDWRLPDAKELQSIVDYDRSPSATHSAAISALFHVPVITDERGEDNYPFYWTSTTHHDGPRPDRAVYICFGEALGYMHGKWLDVHGAGAQRSDPKTGDPADYPEGFGPQGDAIRIDNYVRLVRDVDAMIPTGIMDQRPGTGMAPDGPQLNQNYPNPFNNSTVIRFSLPKISGISLSVFNLAGQRVATLIHGSREAGEYAIEWDGADDAGIELASGIYLYRLESSTYEATRKLLLLQ
jgi:hypothetical protein